MPRSQLRHQKDALAADASFSEAGVAATSSANLAANVNAFGLQHRSIELRHGDALLPGFGHAVVTSVVSDLGVSTASLLLCFIKSQQIFTDQADRLHGLGQHGLFCFAGIVSVFDVPVALFKRLFGKRKVFHDGFSNSFGLGGH